MAGSLAIIVALVLLVLPATGEAAPGDFDPTWGEGGITRVPGAQESTPFSEIEHSISPPGTARLAIQSNGRLLRASGVEDTLRIARLTQDGAGDSRFEPVSVNRCGPVEGMELMLDDSALVLGTNCLLRIKPNGGLKKSFGTNGKVALKAADALAVDAQGRSVVAFTRTIDGREESFLSRFNESGQVDQSFGEDGTTAVDGFSNEYGPLWFRVQQLAIDSEDRILMAGLASNHFDPPIVVGALAKDGEVDESFSPTGLRHVSCCYGYYLPTITDLELQSDGSILVLWAKDAPSLAADELQGALARLRPQGGLDSQFAGDGELALAIERPDLLSYPKGLALTDSGDILVVGTRGGLWSTYPCCFYTDSVVAKITDEGEFDTGFADDGVFRFDEANPDGANAVAVDGERVYVSGVRARQCCGLGDVYPYVAALKLGEGPADRDADGLGDLDDPCPTVFDPAGQGCPESQNRIRFEPGKKQIRVALDYESTACAILPILIQRRERDGSWVTEETLIATRPYDIADPMVVGKTNYSTRPSRALVERVEGAEIGRRDDSPAVADCTRDVARLPEADR